MPCRYNKTATKLAELSLMLPTPRGSGFYPIDFVGLVCLCAPTPPLNHGHLLQLSWRPLYLRYLQLETWESTDEGPKIQCI
jgi:hypothetical protein